MDPWRFVDAEDHMAADFLAGTVDLVLGLGGWLHPDARVVERGGQFSLSCDAETGQPLIRLPRQAFVRVGRVTWSDSVERLEVLDTPADLGDAEAELLILQTALHNACDRIPWLVATHPVLAPDLSPDVIDAVRAFRPSFRLRQPTPASLLWSTRAFRLPLGPAGEPEPVCLPLVDLLNHASGGATGTWTGESFDVHASRPTSTGECLLDYGLQRDAIGMAVVYGFADESCPVAHSAPVTVDVPGVGRVVVAAKGRARSGDLLPPVVTPSDEGAAISHLTFREGGRADLVEGLARASGWSDAECAEIVEAVAEANLALVEALTARASELPDAPAARVLSDAARRQRSVLLAGVS